MTSDSALAAGSDDTLAPQRRDVLGSVAELVPQHLLGVLSPHPHTGRGLLMLVGVDVGFGYVKTVTAHTRDGMPPGAP